VNGSEAIANVRFGHPSFSLLRRLAVILPASFDAATITIAAKSPPIRSIGRGAWTARGKWRAEHPDYWTRLREQNPAQAERNRQRQRQRDRQRRQRRLANNNSAPNLANNNPAIPQPLEMKSLALSCQQQPSGQKAAFCPIKGSEPCSPPIRSTICITCIGARNPVIGNYAWRSSAVRSFR
jgi:hypothetical protein